MTSPTITRVGHRTKIAALGCCLLLLTEAALTLTDRSLQQRFGTTTGEPLALADFREVTPQRARTTVAEVRAVIGPGRGDTAEVTQSTALEGYAVWERESHFLMRANLQRQGPGPWLVPQLPVGTQERDVTRLLTVGDSHSWGLGLHDLDRNWANGVERELNELAGGRAYAVEGLGRPMASFYDYADWLTAGVVQERDPDAIVIGYHFNDALPSGRERRICGEASSCEVGDSRNFHAYRRCVAGRDGVFGAVVRRAVMSRHPSAGRWVMERYCDIERFSKEAALPNEAVMAVDPRQNPYAGDFRQAVRDILVAAEGRPVVVVPIWPSRQENGFLRLLAQEGMTVLDPTAMPETYALTGHIPGTNAPTLQNWAEVRVHPADCCHFSPLYYSALARDAARSLRDLLPSDPVPLQGERAALVSNFLPAELVVEETPGRVSIALPRIDAPDSGDGADTQLVGCAKVGRPHVQVMFDLPGAAGTRLAVSVERTVRPLLVAVTGYDRAGRWVTGPFRALPAGTSTTLTVGGTVGGLLIADETTGCPADEVLALEPFVLQIERLP